jgi:hypothetical protein
VLDFKFQSRIKDETKIIKLNDTVGVKLVIARSVEFGSKKYLYKLSYYKKDFSGNCWRSYSGYGFMTPVYHRTVSLNGTSFMLSGTSLFVVYDGWITFD